jgi:hypothetical protein
MRRCVIVSLAIAAVLSACGGPSYSDDVIVAEAEWLCDLPRFAYGEAVDIDAERAAMLADAGVALEVYDDFKAHLDDDAGLRRRVAEAFDIACGEG